MKTDMDLQFLQYCNNEDLRALCDILVYDNKGELRLSESLSISDSYLSCYPDNMRGMWRDLAAELQCYGGNTLLNLFRHGHGPKYESIVYDVCQKMGVENVGKHDTAEDMEQKLLIAVSSKAMEEMTEEQIRAVMEECGVKGYDYTRTGLLAALLTLRLVNKGVFAYVIDAILKMLMEILMVRGIIRAGFGLLSRGVGVLCGPVGWIILTGWTLWDIMGPAYRVTIPAVIQVAYMRMKYQEKLNRNEEAA